MTQQSVLKQVEKIIVHIDPEIADLIPVFFENRHKDIKTIGEALTQGDFETIKIIGHNMKGSGGSYGFDAISDIGKSLEQTAITQDTVGIKKYLQDLSAYLDGVEMVYK
jgi:HPt (histidine-containing phosphotransfer) domain-containing protein